MLRTREFLWPKLRETFDDCLIHFAGNTEPFYFQIGQRGGGPTLALSLAQRLQMMHGGRVLFMCQYREAALARAAEFAKSDIECVAISASGIDTRELKDVSDAVIADVFITQWQVSRLFQNVKVVNIGDFEATKCRIIDTFISVCVAFDVKVIIDSPPAMHPLGEQSRYRPQIKLSAWDSNPDISPASWRKVVSPMSHSERAAYLHACGGGSPYPY